ncbi:MAG: cytochrome c peroxidase [Phycisphaerales bacterium JB059]
MPSAATRGWTMTGAALASLLAGGALFGAGSRGGPAGLPPVPVPPENPITEAKRVLGKLLFWDEQLSSDNTMSCGTCHIPAVGGADPVLGRHPGPDGAFETGDDLRTSFGMIRADANDDYAPDPLFGLEPQSTPRTAPPVFMAAYTPELFWEGRAGGTFVDPATGQTIIASGGAMEAQILQPPLSDVEMAHEARDWDQIARKIRRARPMALATDLPPDMQGAVDAHATYADLFEAAFGDPAVSGARIAMAIATYERTLVPDQTPWDAYIAGDTDALTPLQIEGWNLFRDSECSLCHTPPAFTDFSFRNIGVRPGIDDIGREEVTGDPADRGKFKVPTLRNVALKRSFMHTGEFQLFNTVFNFYVGPGAEGNPNRDPILPVAFGANRDPVVNFLEHGLVDPRVASETFPFDRPTLHSENAPNPELLDGGEPGTGGVTPRIIANAPPNIGNLGFKVGLESPVGGASARLIASESAPVGGRVREGMVLGRVTTEPAGHATLHYPIPFNALLAGRELYVQWIVDDPSGVGGASRTRAARLTFFSTQGAPPDCPADLAEPFEALDFADVSRFLDALGAGEPVADVALPLGVLDFSDVAAFLASFDAGCP